MINGFKYIVFFLCISACVYIWGVLFIKQNLHKKVKVGQKWEYISHKENPFETPDTTHYVILDINGKYIKYLDIERGDTTIRSGKKITVKWNSKLIKNGEE